MWLLPQCLLVNANARQWLCAKRVRLYVSWGQATGGQKIVLLSWHKVEERVVGRPVRTSEQGLLPSVGACALN